MKFLILGLICLGLSSCTSAGKPSSPIVAAAGCSAEQVVSSALAGSIASTLQCTNQSAIQASLQGAFGSLNLCAAAQVQAQVHALQSKKPSLKGIGGDIVCPLAVSAVMGLLGTQVPAAWGCSALASSGIDATLSSACVAVVPF